jgi:glycosyltransferase involved in cell wall biosynthesis
VCVGRLCRQKGQDVLLEAWSQIAKPDRTLTLIGGGPELEPLRARWAGPDIRFEGETDRRTALDWMAAADIVVLPSRWEGLALVPLESLAVGTPVVATEVNGACEVLTSEVGSVVAVDDPAQLAAAVDRWLDRTDTGEVRQLCRRRVTDAFDVQDTLAAIDRALREIGGGQ